MSKKKKLLFGHESECVRELRELMARQSHRTLILWAFDVAKMFLALFLRYCPNDGRPQAALDAADAWSRGDIKMPQAKQAILGSHKAAADAGALSPVAEAAARAVAHAAATVHVGTHAMGPVLYGLTAVAREAEEQGTDADAAVTATLAFLGERLSFLPKIKTATR